MRPSAEATSSGKHPQALQLTAISPVREGIECRASKHADRYPRNHGSFDLVCTFLPVPCRGCRFRRDSFYEVPKVSLPHLILALCHALRREGTISKDTSRSLERN